MSSQIEISNLEQFLLSENKEEFIAKLIPGTDSFYYFSLLHGLNKYGVKLPKELDKYLESYKKFTTKRSKNIELRQLFMQLDQGLKEEETKKILKAINDKLFHVEFEYEEPKTIITTKAVREIKEQIQSTYSEKDSVQQLLEASYTDLKEFQKLTPKAYSLLQYNKLKSCNFDIIKYFLQNAKLDEFDFATDLIQVYCKLLKERKNAISNVVDYSKLTKQQMKQLTKKVPEIMNDQYFIGELFKKEFEIDEKKRKQIQGSPEEKKKKYQEIKQMYEWTKTLPHKFQSLSDQLLYEMLQLGIETNHYDFDYFILYLKDPKEIYPYANEKQSRVFQQQKKIYEPY